MTVDIVGFAEREVKSRRTISGFAQMRRASSRLEVDSMGLSQRSSEFRALAVTELLALKENSLR